MAVSLAGAAVLVALAWATHHQLTAGPAPEAAVEAMVLHDPSDDGEVAAAATALWHGTVLRRTGDRTIAGIPSVRYEVTVGRVFKGEGLAGTVVVTLTPDDRPLEDGARYIFPTVPWQNTTRDGHAVLAEAQPRPADDLTAPAAGGGTVAEHWTRLASAAAGPAPGA
ncbi:hypothetical protein ACFVIM_30875 [Streptomyces sp. NPDC057638]|uniref:hypothetical protein n=1 Tax=Streptomyces sp. NPDC057638 TaxID=3346190 RepID=UPI0036CA5D82